MSKKVLITTVPFGEAEALPLELLNSSDIEYVINPLGRKLKEEDLLDLVPGFDAIIAGTEPLSATVLERAKDLKLISRVGIGVDSVDLNFARQHGVKVTYTPDAPAPAVAELTMGLMLSLLRSIHLSNLGMRKGQWQRFFGRRISEITIGIIGTGRIGARIIRRVKAFGTPTILANDLSPDNSIDGDVKINWVSKEEIYKNADLITLHLPLTKHTYDMIGEKELAMMKPDALLINASRGGIINERALANALRTNSIGGAAIDVFEEEPYQGELINLDNCLLTSHMGSMSIDCRSRMEIEATEEILRFFKGKELKNPVPESEYKIQAEGLSKND